MDEKLTLGEVVNGTFATVGENKEAALIFVAVLTVLGTGFEWGLAQLGSGALDQYSAADSLFALFGIGAGLGGLLYLVVSIVGQYLLWEMMLKRYHMVASDYDRRILAFVGLSILTGLGIAIGYVLLIVPGLIFSARWAMAPALLIGEGKGVTDSMSASWDEVSGNTTPVALAILIAGVAVIGISMVVGGGLAATADVSLVTTVVTQLLSQAVSVLNAALGVFLFGRLRGSPDTLTTVFE